MEKFARELFLRLIFRGEARKRLLSADEALPLNDPGKGNIAKNGEAEKEPGEGGR